VKAAFNALWWKLRGYDLIATELEQESRWGHCLPCGNRVGRQCALCTCFLDAKTMLTSESCPDKKWGRVLRKRSTL
jgi:hypothetical protein